VVIRQGEVYWLDVKEPGAPGPALIHPHLVVQNDVFNRSRLRTTVVCALTSNLASARSPGNVRLDEGDAGLPKASVVNVTQVFAVDKARLVEKIGNLSAERLRAVISGLELLFEPRETISDRGHPPPASSRARSASSRKSRR